MYYTFDKNISPTWGNKKNKMRIISFLAIILIGCQDFNAKPLNTKHNSVSDSGSFIIAYGFSNKIDLRCNTYTVYKNTDTVIYKFKLNKYQDSLIQNNIMELLSKDFPDTMLLNKSCGFVPAISTNISLQKGDRIKVFSLNEGCSAGLDSINQTRFERIMTLLNSIVFSDDELKNIDTSDIVYF